MVIFTIIYAVLFYIILGRHTQKGETDLYYPLACDMAEGKTVKPLRGWLEIMPLAYLFRWFGKRLEILHLLFYVGNVATIIVVFEIISHFKPVNIWFVFVFLIFNVMPTFKWWGGFRMFFGALAVLLAIKGQFFLSGLACGIGFFYSFEMGLIPLVAVLFTHQLSILAGFLLALVCPGKHTIDYIRNILRNRNNYVQPWGYVKDPCYQVPFIFRAAFLFLFFPLVYSNQYIALWVYGLLMYVAAFRNIGGAELFPALQILFALSYLRR